MLYYRDITEYEEEFFDANYSEIYQDLIADGYNAEEAQELAMEELCDLWRAENANI